MKPFFLVLAGIKTIDIIVSKMSDTIIKIVEKERKKISDEDFLKKCFSNKKWHQGLNKNELIRLKYLSYTPIYWEMMPTDDDDDDEEDEVEDEDE